MVNQKEFVILWKFAVLMEQRMKMKDSDKIHKFLDLVRKQKQKFAKPGDDWDTNWNWCAWSGALKNNWKSKKESRSFIYSIVKIC